MDLLQVRETYDKAAAIYQPVLDQIALRDEIYNGTHRYRYGKRGEKFCQNVRNIVFELIESQIDTSIPLPVVEAVCESDEEAARMIEGSLKSDIEVLDLAKENDLLERIVPIQGYGIFEVYWEDEKVKVRALHPSQLIPQPGLYEIQEMDYFFIRTEVTRRYILERYGVELPDGGGSETTANPEEVVEEVVCWYRGEDGAISRYIFCGEVELEDISDYYARKARVCKNCGCLWVEEECPCCGGRESVERAVCDEVLMVDREGNRRRTEIPYYKPDCYPFIIWENVPKCFSFGGQSDVDVISDQQEVIKRLYTKVEQKLLKGGSYIQIPANMQTRFTPDEEELKVIYSNPMDAPVSVHTIQPDISKDLTLIRDQIQAAQSTLGLNDSFQGKTDPSATSGTAKRLLIEQANGRLQSKQSNKYRAYRELYRMIYRFKLAFADEPVPYVQVEAGGKRCYCHFDRRKLIIPGKDGGYTFNDRFIFTVDASGGLPHDRGYLYEQSMKLYQMGGFGSPGTTQALRRLWNCLESVQFPLAAQIIMDLEEESANEDQAGEGRSASDH